MTDLTNFRPIDNATGHAQMRAVRFLGDITHALAVRLALPVLGLGLLWLVIEADPNKTQTQSAAPLSQPEQIHVSSLPG